MSLYLELDSDGPFALASNTGWGDVCRYADSLPAGVADTLKHLCLYGWEQDIAILLREIPAATAQTAPRPDVADTIANLLTLLNSKPTAVVIAVTNGMTADATTANDKADPGKKNPPVGKNTAAVAAGGTDKSDTSNALGKGGKVSGTPGSQRAMEASLLRSAQINTASDDSALTLERGDLIRILTDEYAGAYHLERHEAELLDELLPDCKTPEMVRAAYASLNRGIYLCRHAQTDASKAGNLRGWMDFPLNNQGKKDSVTVGEWLQGKSVEQIRRSDLTRAKQTSRRIMDQLGIEQPYETGFWYRDWSLGLLDGRPQGDVDALIADYVTTNRDNAPDAGETFNKFLSRCLPRIRGLMDVVADPDQSGAVIALVTHSSVLRAVAAWMTAGAKDPTGDTTPYVIDPTTFLTLPIADSSVIWLSLTPAGWKWKLIDPLGNADLMGTPR